MFNMRLTIRKQKLLVKTGILCTHYDVNTTPICGKSSEKYCSLKYIILEILTCSLIVHLVGFSTAFWSHGTEFYHNGLWMLCGLNKQKNCQYLPYDAGNISQQFEHKTIKSIFRMDLLRVLSRLLNFNFFILFDRFYPSNQATNTKT